MILKIIQLACRPKLHFQKSLILSHPVLQLKLHFSDPRSAHCTHYTFDILKAAFVLDVHVILARYYKDCCIIIVEYVLAFMSVCDYRKGTLVLQLLVVHNLSVFIFAYAWSVTFCMYTHHCL